MAPRRSRAKTSPSAATGDDHPALRRALHGAEARLTSLGDHEQLHVDLAVQVASLSPKEIARLAPDNRQLVTQLRAEQGVFLRDILEKVAAFEKATPGSKRQRAAANAVSYLMGSARRRVVYRLTPRVARSILRASWMVRAPIGMLYHLSPPMVRPVVHGVMLARTLVRGVRWGLG